MQRREIHSFHPHPSISTSFSHFFTIETHPVCLHHPSSPLCSSKKKKKTGAWILEVKERESWRSSCSECHSDSLGHLAHWGQDNTGVSVCLRGQGSNRHKGTHTNMLIETRLVELLSGCEDGPQTVNQCFTHDSPGVWGHRAGGKSSVLHQPPAANKLIIKYFLNTHVYKTTNAHNHYSLTLRHPVFIYTHTLWLCSKIKWAAYQGCILTAF